MKRRLGGQGSGVPCHLCASATQTSTKMSQTQSSKGKPEDKTAEGSQTTSENTAAFQGK